MYTQNNGQFCVYEDLMSNDGSCGYKVEEVNEDIFKVHFSITEKVVFVGSDTQIYQINV